MQQSEELVWTGKWVLPRDRQGLLVLGTPLGANEHVATISGAGSTRLTAVAAFLQCFLHRAGPITSCAMCSPALTAHFAAYHDAAVATCLDSPVHCGNEPSLALQDVKHSRLKALCTATAIMPIQQET